MVEHANKYLFLVFSVIYTFGNTTAYAQLSPPGMEDTHFVLWGAIGINQSIGKKWFNQSYIGGARFSQPNNNSILKRQAIYVVEQQTYRKFGQHWSLGLCVSLRGQNMYMDDPPYDNEIPSIRREMRYYLRLFYRHKTGRFSFAYSLRPEWRRFYSPDWSHYYESPQMMRYRAKAHVGISLNPSKTKSFIFMNEFLFVNVQNRQPSGALAWQPLAMSEDRICTYFRQVFTKPAVAVDIGLMQQLNMQNGKFVSDYVHFAFDVILMDPFGKPKQR
ncbi:MAG: DUF2490 domain-containing protein [Bacteroidetes bacterium]|nr:DUF2490 domain-containing protein [Bacteroidota bacterium]